MQILELIQMKILTQDELLKRLFALRFHQKKIVFTNGCFDVLHPGHVYYLNQARSLGDVLVVGLNSDASIKMLNKGIERPIHPQDKRAEVLASLFCVDFVTIFEEETPFNLIQKVQPDVLVKGGDYTIDKIVGADFVHSYGGSVAIIPLLEGYSTTEILNKLRK